MRLFSRKIPKLQTADHKPLRLNDKLWCVLEYEPKPIKVTCKGFSLTNHDSTILVTYEYPHGYKMRGHKKGGHREGCREGRYGINTDSLFASKWLAKRHIRKINKHQRKYQASRRLDYKKLSCKDLTDSEKEAILIEARRQHDCKKSPQTDIDKFPSVWYR